MRLPILLALTLAACAAGDPARELPRPATFQVLRSGRLDLGAAAECVALARPLAFVACGDEGIHVVDVSDPGSPQQVAVIEELAASDLAYHDDQLFALAPAAGWWFGGGGSVTPIDVIDPRAPEAGRAVERPFPGTARIAASVAVLAVAAGEAGLYLTGGPLGTLALESELPAAGAVDGVLAAGDRVFALVRSRPFDFWSGYGDDRDTVLILATGATGTAGGGRPVGELEVAADDGPPDLALSRDWLLVCRSGGILVVDVRQPREPLYVGELALPDLRALACDGALAAAAGGDGALHLLDLDAGGVPRADPPLAGLEEPRDVAVQGDLVVVADGAGGLRVFEVRRGPPE